MDPLDTKSMYYSPESTSNWPQAIRYGGYWAAAGAVITLVGFLTNTEPGFPSTSALVKTFYTIASLGFTVWCIREAVLEDRKNLGGYIEFGRIFGLTMKMGLIAAVLGALFYAIYTNLINAGYFEALMEDVRQDLENKGMADDQIEVAMQYSKMFSGTGAAVLMQLFVTLIFSAIIGLITGAVMKKPPYKD